MVRIKTLMSSTSNHLHWPWVHKLQTGAGNPLSSVNRWSWSCRSLSWELDVFRSLALCWSFYINTGCYDHQPRSGLISNPLKLTFSAPQGAAAGQGCKVRGGWWGCNLREREESGCMLRCVSPGSKAVKIQVSLYLTPQSKLWKDGGFLPPYEKANTHAMCWW